MHNRGVNLDIINVLKSRRTVRSFTDDPIKKECIIEMIDCARVSPSAANMQSIKYLIVDSFDDRKAIFSHIKYAGYIQNWNPEFSESPVAYIAVLNDTDIQKTNGITECDCGIAMMSIIMSATDMGIGSCILGAIDKDAIRRLLGIKEQYDLMYLIGLGISKQNNLQFDSDDSVKYILDESGNFLVPKRTLDNILIDKGEIYNG